MKLFTKNMDANASEGIKADLEKIFMNEKNGVKSAVGILHGPGKFQAVMT